MSLKPPDGVTASVPSVFDELETIFKLADAPTGVEATDTANLVANIAEASGDGLGLRLRAGTYAVNSQITSGGNPGQSSAVPIVGAGPGKTVIEFSHDGRVINFGQSLGTAVAVTEDLAIGERQINVASTPASLVVGDWIEVRSEAAFPGTTKSAVVGELARVESIDSATSVTVLGPLEETYSLSDNPTIRRVPMIEGVLLKDFTIRLSDPESQANQLEAIRLNQTSGARIENVYFEDLDNTAIKVSDSVDWHFDSLRFLDGNNDDVNDRFPYGVAAFNASRNGVVSNCFMNKGRHLFTTAGTATRSVPKHITISNCHGTNVDSTPFDTHEEGRFITFDNCKATNCTWNGFSARAPDTLFKNCEALATDRAVTIATTGHRSKVFGGSFRYITRQTTTTAYGIHVEAEDCEIYWPSIDETDDIGIEIAATGDRCKVRATVKNPGNVGTSSCVRVNGADECFVEGHFEDATTGLQVTSAATNMMVGPITWRNVTTVRSLNASATYLPRLVTKGVQVLATDAGTTLGVKDDPEQLIHTGTLTADRAITLSTTGATLGDRFKITRTGSGAFNLTIGTGPLKSLVQNTWCEVTYDGSAWKLTAYGAL